MNASYETVRDFLYREARYLDDKDWDNWLELYAADASFWMPSWDDDDELTTDPQSEISLIWYGNRGGLEDRVFRIKTERSSATMPDTRTPTTSATSRSSRSPMASARCASTGTP